MQQSLMEGRKGDPRIYIVSALFFSCIISGGVLLGLYIFLPENDVKPWYPTAGLILVGIPWAFWLLTYLYRCIRPSDTQFQQPKSVLRSMTANTEGTAVTPKNPSSDESSFQSPLSPDGARHVHFGGVVVISEDKNKNGVEQDGDEGMEGHSVDEHEDSTRTSQERENSVNSRESEMPLAFSLSS